MTSESHLDERLVALSRFDYSSLPGPSFEAWEAAVRELREEITGGRNRGLARRLIPLMLDALESTDGRDAAMIDVREEAIRTLGEAPELLDDRALAVLRASVANDDFYEVAPIAAGVLDDVDPREGDEAWRTYTGRLDAPADYKKVPKPPRG